MRPSRCGLAALGGRALPPSEPQPQSRQRLLRLLVSAGLTADEVPAAGGFWRFVPPHGFSRRFAAGRNNRMVSVPDGNPRPTGQAGGYDFIQGPFPLENPPRVPWICVKNVEEQRVS